MVFDQISPGFLILCAAWYFGSINLLAYLCFGVDKRWAETGDWRVPERTLLMLAGLGGWPGAKVAQRRFRHKTRKQPFGIYLNLSGMFLPAVVLALIGLTRVEHVDWPGVFSLVAGQGEAKAALPRRFGPGS